jgi:aspartate/methionine/tyrosine aminotransferase
MNTTASRDRRDSARTRPKRLIDLRGDRLGLATAPHVRDAAKRALDDGETHYTTRPGLNPLRHAIAEKLERENGIRVHAEREVLVTCGTREALFVALHVLLERGDQVVIAGPAAPLYRSVARLAGGTGRVVAGDPGDGFAVDADAIARRLTRRTRAIVLISPSSPAGSVADAARLDALAELAIARSLAVVSVETLEPFIYEGAVGRSIGSLPGMGDRTVTINGFSEAHGLAGWRVGYMAGPESLLAPMTQLKQAMSICSPAVSQHAALAAATGSRESIESAHALVAERRGRFFAALQEAGVVFARPAAGYHVLVDVGAPTQNGSLQRALRGARLRVASGATVGAPGWLPLSLTRPSDELAEAATRLGCVLAEAKGGKTDG